MFTDTAECMISVWN